MPLANVAAAQRELLGELEEFNRFAAKPAERLAVMEALREAVHFVQVEQAKRFTQPRAADGARPRPPPSTTRPSCGSRCSVGYSHCLEAALAGEGGMRVAGAR